ncbi:hypothetical protein TNCV_2195401 [Trichonephila clavipes]|uniref:Uncharacterized protein n=1 Tax=Trichonephila clavipes TaxID=2585209 RepID=A0A8X6VKL2_TRICX|nr:hypothetical protein TNCV_2195401 [Trichonephila clavipes]
MLGSKPDLTRSKYLASVRLWDPLNPGPPQCGGCGSWESGVPAQVLYSSFDYASKLWDPSPIAFVFE